MSPNKKWTLVYDEPFEFSMGAEAWSASLIKGDKKILGALDRVHDPSAGRGFICHENDRPWRSDSEALAFLLWDEPCVRILTLSSRKMTPINERTDSVLGIMWSPVSDLLLVTDRRGARIYRSDAGLEHSASWKVSRYEDAICGWLGSGKHYFFIGRHNTRSKTKMHFYDSRTSNEVEVLDLDPVECLPYESKNYGRISRGSYSLRLSSGAMGVGALLDTWNRWEFEAETKSLYLSVHRPVGKPFRREGKSVVNAEERFVRVDLEE